MKHKISLLLSLLLLTASFSGCMGQGEADADTNTLVSGATVYSKDDNNVGQVITEDNMNNADRGPLQEVTYLWDEGNMPASTVYPENSINYFDPPDFRPNMVYVPAKEGVDIKGAVLICAGGAFQVRADSDGFPNWWYDLPMVMYSFFEEYDFSGKTIIPFCSHNGSRFSNTIKTIQELEPNATVITEGFTVNQSGVQDAAEDVEAWLHDLGY